MGFNSAVKGLITEQLHGVSQKGHLSSPENSIINMGKNDLRSKRKLEFLLGEFYVLVATAKRKFRTAQLP
jgi:hypothetical protein